MLEDIIFLKSPIREWTDLHYHGTTNILAPLVDGGNCGPHRSVVERIVRVANC